MIAVAAVVVVVVKVRKVGEVASETAGDSETAFDALDQATRAPVIGKLPADAVQDT